jgi:putative ABC transport system substrate-binding protein
LAAIDIVSRVRRSRPWRLVPAAVLAAFMLFAGLPSAIPAAAATGDGQGDTAPATSPAHEGPYRIMMILWRGCEDACRGFTDYFAMRGIPVEFITRDAQQDASKIPAIVAEAKAMHVDLVLTWGTTVTLKAVGTWDAPDPATQLTDIPVVFMIVTDPVVSKVVPNVDGSGRNVTGTLTVVPEDVQMRAIESYRPFHKIGVIYNTDESNAVASVQKLQPVADAMGFELVTREVPMGADGKPDPASLPRLIAELAAEKVDYLYIGSSSFILVNQDVFTEAAIENGIPVAAAGEVPVRQSNALMGLVSGYYNLGGLTAAKAEEILVGGKAPGEIPIRGLSRFSLIVNMDAARRLQLYPPLGLLRFAEVIKTDPAAAN